MSKLERSKEWWLAKAEAELAQAQEAIRLRDLNDNGLFMEAWKHKARADALEEALREIQHIAEDAQLGRGERWAARVEKKCYAALAKTDDQKYVPALPEKGNAPSEE